MFEIPYLRLVTRGPEVAGDTYMIQIIVKMSNNLHTLKRQIYLFIIELL